MYSVWVKDKALVLVLYIGFWQGLSANPADDNQKFDCFPEESRSKDGCLSRGCLWDENRGEGVPACYYDSTKFGYVSEQPPSGSHVTIKASNGPGIFPYPKQIKNAKVEITELSYSILRLKIFDNDNMRYEVPLQLMNVSSQEKPKMYDYKYGTGRNFSIQITAKRPLSNGSIGGVKIWDTSVGALMMADQFLQISSLLPSSNLYGIGETNRGSFRQNISSWKRIGLFSRDQPPYPDSNLYGVHPFYLLMEEDGSAHGVLLLNSNAMDVTLQPTPAITYRVIGGILDFYFFFGPTPEDVVMQYTSLIGRPVMPAYWSLGFQLSRYGYNSLDAVKETVARMKKYDIPQDVQYGDIDYMERQLDFTYNNVTYKGLPEYVRQIKEDGIRYITILDPAISANETGYDPYDRGVRESIFIKNQENEILFGKVWPDLPGIFVNTSWPWENQTETFRAYAAFPDWFHPSISKWWPELIKEFHKTIEFDGLWIDMNEPANFVNGGVHGCPNNSYENPPYKPNVLGQTLADKTLCMSGKHADGQIEYNYHSLFGWKQAQVTKSALEAATGKRGIVLSRSTFPASGHYAGHWLGDNKSEWPQMHESIVGMLDFSLFGIPYIGADICGFHYNASRELCMRWMQLGSFYPFCRNHNGLGYQEQDPAWFGPEFAQQARSVLHARYNLLPYLYTLFWLAHTTGSTVARPLMHEFPKDKATWSIDRQFMWGSGLLITPALQQGVDKVTAYAPLARWYSYFTHEEMHSFFKGEFREWNTPANVIGVHIRGGSIIPTQLPERNTMLSRERPMSLIVALSESGTAEGQLFWDDGESIDMSKYLLLRFSANQSALSIQVVENSYPNASALYFDNVRVLGLETAGMNFVVTVDGVKNGTVENPKTGVLNVYDLRMAINKPHTVKWSHQRSPASRSLPSLTVVCACIIWALRAVLFS